MCGISALIAPEPRELGDSLVRMTDVIRHRGPDDEGFVLFRGRDVLGPFGGSDTPEEAYAARDRFDFAPTRDAVPAGPASVALGHRRLSIVDLSPAGHQPMSYGDDVDGAPRYWCVYNGEVYDWVELRAELEALGHEFRTHTDTEVVLAAYAQWGEACVERFNGMWALVLLDRAEKVVFASRDRFGIKPLYHWTAPDGTLAFASEIKQLAELPGWSARANGPRLHDFLAWSTFDHTAETQFEGVLQVRGGHGVRVELDRVHAPAARRWYDLRAASRERAMAPAAERVRELLGDSVRLRLRADVKVGSCLSGGVDSSSIVCLVHQALEEAGKTELQETVSSCSELRQFDEREFIEAVRDRNATTAHYVFPDTDRLFDDLGAMVWHQDEPFASTSIFAQWCVFEKAREAGLIVMLDGQGADELFAGYRTAFPSFGAELLSTGRFGAFVRSVLRSRELHGYRLGKLLFAPLRQLLPLHWRSRGGASLRAPWLDAERLLDGVGAPPRPVPPGRDLEAWSRDQLLTSNLPMLLHYEDRNSMAHSVESRVPFLDYRLVEYVLGLDGELKIADGVTKAVLREAMRDVLPEVVRERQDKMAFVTPQEVWFRDEAARFRPLLERACESANGVFHTDRVLALADEVAAGKKRGHSALWKVLCVGAWAGRFEVA